eukprot:5352388-Amphidinium_carterae.1
MQWPFLFGKGGETERGTYRERERENGTLENHGCRIPPRKLMKDCGSPDLRHTHTLEYCRISIMDPYSVMNRAAIIECQKYSSPFL